MHRVDHGVGRGFVSTWAGIHAWLDDGYLLPEIVSGFKPRAASPDVTDCLGAYAIRCSKGDAFGSLTGIASTAVLFKKNFDGLVVRQDQI
jgi:hypothetical protein